jgi:HrpA-like RNA helicase
MRSSASLILLLSAARFARPRAYTFTGQPFCSSYPIQNFYHTTKSKCFTHFQGRRRKFPKEANFHASSNALWKSEALPIDTVLDELLSALKDNNCCVLQAPPGAGKTTRVPLALLSQPSILPNGVSPENKVMILEPRILAAKASAARMAESLGEPVGKRVGYRVRHDAQV